MSLTSTTNSIGSTLADCCNSLGDHARDPLVSLLLGTAIGTAFTGNLAIGCINGVMAALATAIHAFTLPLFNSLIKNEDATISLIGKVLHAGVSALVACTLTRTMLEGHARIDTSQAVFQTMMITLIANSMRNLGRLTDTFRF
jgi:hypothetical protein